VVQNKIALKSNTLQINWNARLVKSQLADYMVAGSNPATSKRV